jgi:dsRNA-specific ribonuclease
MGNDNRPNVALRKVRPHKRSISSRIVYDNEFGDTLASSAPDGSDLTKHSNAVALEQAQSSFVRAVIGSIYMHSGRRAAKTFIQHHILSRHLQMSKLFHFKEPTRDLSRLCAREGFQSPVARLISETGRHSRHPVFVVGVFSGNDKLGEASGSSLNEARVRASAQALKSWYLYSPNGGVDVRVPSEMEDEGAKPWEPALVDCGEVVC